MKIKYILSVRMALLMIALLFSGVLLAQITEEEITIDNTEQSDFIDESNMVLSCIFSHDYDALTEEQKVNQELPLCEEVEVTSEELETEITEENISTDYSFCVPPLEYEAMTNEERISNEAPLCDEMQADEAIDSLKT